MKKFKYPLRITGSEEELAHVANQLIGLGYIFDDRYFPHGKYGFTDLITNSFGKVGYLNFSTSTSMNEKGRIVMNTSDRDLALALAAMVDDDKFYEGEYVKFLDLNGVRSPIPANHGNSSLYRVSKVHLQTILGLVDETGFLFGTNVSTKFPFDAVNQQTIHHVRKATKEEIIEHFKNKNNMITSQGLSMAQTDKLVQVPLSFVREAHAAACAEWKSRIEQVVPQVIERTVKAGDKVSFNSQEKYEYIIAGGNGRAVLVSLGDGSVVSETRAISNDRKITLDELKALATDRGISATTVRLLETGTVIDLS